MSGKPKKHRKKVDSKIGKPLTTTKPAEQKQERQNTPPKPPLFLQPSSPQQEVHIPPPFDKGDTTTPKSSDEQREKIELEEKEQALKIHQLGLEAALGIQIQKQFQRQVVKLQDVNFKQLYEKIQQLLKSLGASKELNLKHKNLGDEGVKALVTAIESQKQTQTPVALTSLNLANTSIGDAGIDWLSQALKFQLLNNLTSLILTRNHIGDKGMLNLAPNLSSQHCQLEIIDLSLNNIEHKGAAALAKEIQAPGCKLKQLNLANNPIGYIGIITLAQAVARCRLKGKEITIKGIDNLEQLVKEAIEAIPEAEKTQLESEKQQKQNTTSQVPEQNERKEPIEKSVDSTLPKPQTRLPKHKERSALTLSPTASKARTQTTLISPSASSSISKNPHALFAKSASSLEDDGSPSLQSSIETHAAPQTALSSSIFSRALTIQDTANNISSSDTSTSPRDLI